jgi:hypothetical protein
MVGNVVGVIISLVAVYLQNAGTSVPSVRPVIPVLLAIGSVAIAIFALVRPTPDEIPPDVTLNVVEYKSLPDADGGSLTVNDNGRVDARFPMVDGYLEQQIQLSVESSEQNPLRGARLELRYPPGVEILESKGTQKVGLPDGTNVYEHDLGTIEPGERYYGMATFDMVKVKVDVHHEESCYLDETRMPVCDVAYWIENGGYFQFDCSTELDDLRICLTLEKNDNPPTTVRVDFRLFTEGRPTVEGVMNVELDSGGAETSYDAGPKVLQETDSDPLWNSIEVLRDFEVQDGELLEAWDLVAGKKNPVVLAYKKIRTLDGDIHQHLFVDGVLRKTLIGQTDSVYQQITNIDADPEPEVRKLFASFWMLKWDREQFRIAYES